MKTMAGKPPSFSLTGRVPCHPEFRPARGVIIATDAAINRERARAGSGFIATSGLFGLAAHSQPPGIVGPDAVTVAELRAIWRAIHAIRDDTTWTGKTVILTDSQTAMNYLSAWKKGRISFPPGYQLRDQRASGRKSTLEILAGVMAEDGSRYAFQKVTGHTGNPLNEAADSLAKLALRTGTRNGVTSAEAETAAPVIVASRLSDYWKGNDRD